MQSLRVVVWLVASLFPVAVMAQYPSSYPASIPGDTSGITGGTVTSDIDLDGNDITGGVLISTTTLNAETLAISHSTTSTTPSASITQAGTGDAALKWVLTGSSSYAAGVDNSVSGDPFVISYSSTGAPALGTTNVFSINNGVVTIYNNAGTQSTAMSVTVNGLEVVDPIYSTSTGSDASMRVSLDSDNDETTNISGGFYIQNNGSLAAYYSLSETTGAVTVGLHAPSSATANAYTTTTTGNVNIATALTSGNLTIGTSVSPNASTIALGTGTGTGTITVGSATRGVAMPGTLATGTGTAVAEATAMLHVKGITAGTPSRILVEHASSVDDSDSVLDLNTTSGNADGYVFFGDTATGRWYAGYNNTDSDSFVIGPANAGAFASANSMRFGQQGSGTANTDDIVRILADSAGLGASGLVVTSNSADTQARNLAEIVNDNALATGTTAFYIQQDSVGTALSISSASTTGTAMLVAADSLTTGDGMKISSNSANASTRNVVQILQDHASATGATALRVRSDSTSDVLDLNGGTTDGSSFAWQVFDSVSAVKSSLDTSGNVTFLGGLSVGSITENTTSGNATFAGDIAVNGNDITGTVGSAFNLINTQTASVNIANGLTTGGVLTVGSTTLGGGNTATMVVGGGTGTGGVTVGSTTRNVTMPGTLLVSGSEMRVNSNGQSAARLYTGEGGATGSILEFYDSRGTVAAPTVVASGDEIFRMNFAGYDGTQYLRSAVIYGTVSGTPGANDMPGSMFFETTADGASSTTRRMSIDHTGALGIGTAAEHGATFPGGPMIMITDDDPKIIFKDTNATEDDWLAQAEGNNFYLRVDTSDLQDYSASGGGIKLTVTPAGNLTMAGNVTATGTTVGNGLVGTLGTASQPNVTTLAGVTNIGTGNVTFAADIVIGGNNVRPSGGGGGILLNAGSMEIETNNLIASGARLLIQDEVAVVPYVGSSTSVCRIDHGSGGMWVLGDCSSSERLKHAIKPITRESSSRIHDFAAVAYRYNSEPHIQRYGVIAERVAEHIPEIAYREKDGLITSIEERSLLGLMLAELQNAVKDIASLWDSHDEHEARIAELEARLSALEARQ